MRENLQIVQLAGVVNCGSQVSQIDTSLQLSWTSFIYPSWNSDPCKISPSFPGITSGGLCGACANSNLKLALALGT